MKATLKKPELMAPAGDMISLMGALNAGADAIYFGIVSMNMRSNAKNFAAEQLDEVVKLCHDHGAKAYLALNTIIYDSEIELATKLVEKAAKAGVDAVICWDFAILEAALEHGIEPFISTQMSAANSLAIVSLYKRFGVKRFVMARECTLKELESIRSNLKALLKDDADNIEIEIFAHGAMCVSVSGRCFMSQFHFNKSGNRGECRQPCRREFTITESRNGKSYILGQDYVMSPKDLCTLPFLEQILEAGIDSLKIEGRGRSPEYVSTVTRCYRQFIDFYHEHHTESDISEQLIQLKKRLVTELKSVFNRGFSDGFLFGRQIEDWTGGDGSQATHRKVQIGTVTNFYKKVMVAEIQVKSRGFKAGDELMFQGPQTGVISQIAISIEKHLERVEHAEQGSLVGVKLSEPVRRNDQVYMMVDVDELKNAKQTKWTK